MKSIVLAGGCFWGLEDLLRNRPGVVDTEVGYSGGVNNNPTYDNHPGHAEAIKVSYDPEQTTISQILDYFFRIHDPTTLDRQGNDVGSSYRSAIFYRDDEQKQIAKEYIDLTNKSGLYQDEVVTQLEKLDKFYPAEADHQDYLIKNPGGYSCHFERSSTALKPTDQL